MPLHFLFGPTDALFAGRYLGRWRAAGRGRTFGPQPGDGIDVVAGPAAGWADLTVAMEEGQADDVVVYHPAYQAGTAWLADCPVPVVALALDANLHAHAYRLLLPACAVILADGPTCQALRRWGLTHTREALLHGSGDDWEPWRPADAPRDVDILFLGNTDPAIHRDRLPWLDRLARLAGRYRVRIGTGVFGASYRDLMGRSKIVFNRSSHGEANQRAFETLAAGALLFQEADNAELAGLLTPGQDHVAYAAGDLEEQLARYLGDDDLRRGVAASGQAKLAGLTFAAQWQQTLDRLEEELPELRQRAASRPALPPGDVLLARVWQVLSGGQDARLRADLLEVFEQQADSDAGREAAVSLAVLIGQAGTVDDWPLLARLDRALQTWQERRPADRLLAAHAVALSLRLQQREEAVRRARAALRRTARPLLNGDLDRLPPPALAFDVLRVEWERAAWEPPTGGERAAKANLLSWWLQALIGQVGGSDGDLVAAYEAVLARPELPTTRVLLGSLLAAAGRPDQADAHLRFALAANPLDLRAADLLHRVLVVTRDHDGLAELQDARKLWHQAAPELVPAEPWWDVQVLPASLSPEPPLVSIVILCCNAREVTAGCLESLLAGTHSPYELILVDNGSSDGTLDYLKTLPGRVGPRRWVLLRNESNRGFAAGCNQGLAAANGPLVCFLNNDTVLPAGWLEGLRRGLEAAAGQGPVGMTGPVSNYSLPTQTAPPGYATLAEYPAFAAAWAKEHAGARREVEVLSGFCLLARRDLLAQLAGFDERFGIGTFEDNDLSLRVRQAGFRLVVTGDVYVHHHGNQTFRALGIDPAAQQAHNQIVFHDKWQPGPVTVPVVAPFPVSAAVVVTPARQRVSLCLIVKDEAANLADCLGPVRDLFDEVVVNDTGSTDGTVELARSLGARVVEHPWQDSFAAARNQVLDAATGDWIFWLDADDRVDACNAGKLQRLFSMLAPCVRGYAMTCRCLGPAGDTDVVHVRLFPRHPQVRWDFRVHEQILPAIRAAGGEVVFTDLIIHHVGYADKNLRHRKLDRDLHLLERERQERGDHPFVLFNLGCIHLERDDFAQALPLFETSLAKSHMRDSIVRKLYANIARCRWQLGRRAEALTACRDGLGPYPHDDELLFLLAQYHQEQGELESARQLYHRLIDGPREAAHFGSTATGLRGFRAMNNLALVYRDLGNLAEAERWFRRAVADHPGFVTGWLALGEMLLAQGKHPEVEAIAAELVRQGHPAEAAALRRRRR